jgi:ABC-2 type transport system permease protein
MTLAAQFFKENRRMILFFIIGSIIYAVLVALSIPSLLENQSDYYQLLKSYPKEVLKLLSGSNIDIEKIFTLEGSIAGYFTALWLPVILLGFYLASFSYVISRDFEHGTIEILLSLPVLRRKIVIERSLAVILSGYLISILSMMAFYVVLELSDVKIGLSRLLLAGVHASTFTLVFGCFELLLTAVFLERSKPVGISLSVFLLMHLVETLSDVWKPLEWLSKISLFHYYSPVSALKSGIFPWEELFLFLVLIFLMVIISILIFERRDVGLS